MFVGRASSTFVTLAHIDRASRRLWAAHVAGLLTRDEWATMARIIRAL